MKADRNASPIGRTLAAILMALSLFVLASCILGDKVAGRGSEVENELGVYGVLVDEGGNPVAGAKVTARPPVEGVGKTSAPGKENLDSATDITDSEGRYVFTDLALGEYDLFGDFNSGALVVLVPGIAIQDTSLPVPVGTDTLRAPGRIRGQVRLAGVGKPEVMGYIPGTSYLAVSDDSGRFEITGVPQGRYSVRYLVPGFTLVPDTGVVVRSGQATQLPVRDLTYDTAGNPAPPASLEIEFDTLASAARLRWGAVPVADLAGYLVFRDDGAGGLPRLITAAPVPGTAFSDDLKGVLNDSNIHVFTYRLKSKDRDANQSLEFSPSATIRAVSASRITTTMGVSLRPNGKVGINDTLEAVAWYSNPTHRIRKIEWFTDGGAAPVRVREENALGGIDTLKIAWPDTGMHEILIRAQDASGRTFSLRSNATVLSDPPRIRRDSIVQAGIGDTVALEGARFAMDYLGEVVAYEWDIGAKGGFKAAPGGRIVFISPTEPADRYPCILRVTDEDGEQAQDTIVVRVHLDPPEAVITGVPITAYPGDSLTLSGAQSRDRFGRITSFAWDPGKHGAAVPGESIRIGIPAGFSGAYVCALTVRDEDGLTGAVEVRIPVSPRADWIRVGPETIPFTRNDPSRTLGVVGERAVSLSLEWKTTRQWFFRSSGNLAEWDSVPAAGLPIGEFAGQIVGHAGRIWVFLVDFPAQRSQLWSSVDGRSWERVSDLGFLDDRSVYSCLAHAGRLWVFPQTSESEVWSSLDGKTWEAVSPGTGFRLDIAPVSLGGRMWALGIPKDSSGLGPNSIWSSSGGSAWTRHSVSVFSRPQEHPAFLAHSGRLWVLGGADSSGIMSGEIRSSPDGANWTRALDVPADLRVPSVRFTVFDGKFWALASEEEGGVPAGSGGVWRAPLP